MPLRHGGFRAVQTVANEPAEIRKTDLAADGEVVLAAAVNEINVVALGVAGDVDDICEARCSPPCREPACGRRPSSPGPPA